MYILILKLNINKSGAINYKNDLEFGVILRRFFGLYFFKYHIRLIDRLFRLGYIDT